MRTFQRKAAGVKRFVNDFFKGRITPIPVVSQVFDNLGLLLRRCEEYHFGFNLNVLWVFRMSTRGHVELQT